MDTGANLLLQSLSAALASPKAARNILGVLAVVSRLFTYHRAYDDDLIAFLLIALGARAFGSRSTAWWKAGAAQSLQLACSMLFAGALMLYPDRSVASPVEAGASLTLPMLSPATRT